MLSPMSHAPILVALALAGDGFCREATASRQDAGDIRRTRGFLSADAFSRRGLWGGVLLAIGTASG